MKWNWLTVLATTSLIGCLPAEGSSPAAVAADGTQSTTPAALAPASSSPIPVSSPLPVRSPSSGDITVDTLPNSIVGLDVSQFQGSINWSKVVASGRQFAYVRATYGNYLTDTEFANNWKSQNVITMGAYHFFLPSETGASQAEFFLKVAGPMVSGKNMPPMVDVETLEGQTAATAVQQLQDFLDAVENATGMVPVIYTDLGTWSSYGNPTQFDKYPLYIALPNQGEPEVPPPWSDWLMWQYSWTGSVPGISGAVDLDFFNGSQAQFQSYLKSGGLPF